MRNPQVLLPSSLTSLLLVAQILFVPVPVSSFAFVLLPSPFTAFSTQLASSSSSLSGTTTSTASTTSTTTTGTPILSDIDMMCITNAAELCSHYQTTYDECDIEQREAFLNSLDDQMDLMAERLAMLSSVKKHITAPFSDDDDDGDDNDEGEGEGGDWNRGMEMDFLKGEILDLVRVDGGSSSMSGTSGADETLLGP